MSLAGSVHCTKTWREEAKLQHSAHRGAQSTPPDASHPDNSKNTPQDDPRLCRGATRSLKLSSILIMILMLNQTQCEETTYNSGSCSCSASDLRVDTENHKTTGHHRPQSRKMRNNHSCCYSSLYFI